MATIIQRREKSSPTVDLASVYDEKAGTISPIVYADPAIYELELERIFSRSWLFIAHETQIPKAGDFLSTYMAEDPVIAVRQKDGSVRVFLNQCRHRGMKICRTDGGNAKAFTCTYHGWAYDIAGNLVQVPLEEQSFPNLDKSKWGARQARVDSYKGLIFATWNEEAPTLSDYLGDFRHYFDTVLDASEGGTEAIGGIVKWIIPCNWKFAAEQFASDMYHGTMSHTSPIMAAITEEHQGIDPTNLPGYQFRARNGGHGTGFFDAPEGANWGFRIEQAGEQVEGFDPEAAQSRQAAHLGDKRGTAFAQHLTIFPNFSIFNGACTARVWHPRGPNEIEVWAFGLVDKAASEAEKEQVRLMTTRTFSAGGTWEQDDGENWVEIQRVLRGHEARRTDFNIQMGAGATSTDGPDYPGTISNAYAEEAARGMYAQWFKLMSDADGSASKVGAYVDAAE